MRTELPDGANMITARYVLAIKSTEAKEERYKASYVVEGHLDIMKDYLVHGAQTIKCVSVRILLVVVKRKGFRVYVVDVKFAYPLSKNLSLGRYSPQTLYLNLI